MQRYRHYGTSYSSSPSSVPVEEVHSEEEVFTEEEAEPLTEEEVEPVLHETGRIGLPVDLVWFGWDLVLIWFGLVWLGGINEEAVPQSKEEVQQPVVEEPGMDWCGLALLV